MRIVAIACVTALLAACGQGGDSMGATSNADASTPKPKKKRPPYCFFKDPETKKWAAKRSKDGNIVVTGRAYRSDGRYQAVLLPPVISGTAATISPTITPNMTGYSTADDWWSVNATIPNSAAIETVTVTCGEKVLAEFKLSTKR